MNPRCIAAPAKSCADLPASFGGITATNALEESPVQFKVLGPRTLAAERAIRVPWRNQHVEIDEAALSRLVEVTRGYACFLQQWGFHTWEQAAHSMRTGRSFGVPRQLSRSPGELRGLWRHPARIAQMFQPPLQNVALRDHARLPGQRQCEPVSRVVVAGFTEWVDVGSLDHREPPFAQCRHERVHGLRRLKQRVQLDIQLGEGDAVTSSSELSRATPSGRLLWGRTHRRVGGE
jgi:hypothetical protein